MTKYNAAAQIHISKFLQSPLNIKLARVVPVAVLRLHICLLGIIFYASRPVKIKKIVKATKLAFFKGSSKLRNKLYAAKIMLGIFEHYLEKLLMAYRPFSTMRRFLQKNVICRHKHLLDSAVSQGKGGIIVTGHFGAVEYLPLTLALNGYKVAMVVRFKTARLREELMKRAALSDVVLIDADQPRVAMRAIEAIRNGRFLITECDEFSEWRGHKTRKVPIFGFPVARDRTLDFFYRKAGVPVFLTLVKRCKKGFELYIEKLASGSEAVSVSELAWLSLEKQIKLAPEQWYQWPDAITLLEGFIEKGEKDDEKKYPIPDLPTSDTVLSAG